MTNYYVDNSVGGPGSGTIGDPWDDLETNLGSLNPGDTCYVRGDSPGTRDYNEGAVTVGINGTAANPITIKAYPGENVCWKSGNGDDTFTFNGSYINFEDFEIDKEDNDGFPVHITDLSSNIVIDTCVIHNGSEGSIIRVRGESPTITGCTIHSNFNGAYKDANGISIGGPATDVTVTDCTVYGCAGDGIQIFRGAGAVGNVLIQGNTVYNTLAGGAENGLDCKEGTVTVKDNIFYGWEPCDGSTGGSGAPNAGVAMTFHQSSDPVVISGNEVYESEIALYLYSRSNVEVYQNVFHDLHDKGGYLAFIRVLNCTNIDIYNNTFANSAGESIIWSNSTGTFRNNIVEGATTIDDDGSPPTADHNCWYNVTESWSGTGDVTSDPLFADEANEDYTLQAGSPCIDAGVDLGLAYEGSAPDLGYSEYTGAAGVANVLAVMNNETTVLLIDTDGDWWADGTWNTFDEYDDPELLRLINEEFGQWTAENAVLLERLNLVAPDGMFNVSGLLRLLTGALRKQRRKLMRLRALAEALP